MSSEEVVRRFRQLYLGDSLLEVLEIRTGLAECHLTFNAGKILKAEGASIFDPAERFEPAFLTFAGVRSIAWDGAYQLNSTVVDFGASPGPGDYVDFYFDLTGGTDPEAFQVRIDILAQRFDFRAIR